jgi:transcriptional regulator with XRE-family HTH domain
MRASRKVPAQERPTFYLATGLQQARLDAGMSIKEVAAASGYNVGTIRSMESGTAYHSMSISRASSVIEGHDLSEIRDGGD